jgi:hypothetical protein
MRSRQWKALILMVMAFGIQQAFAGEVWLMISSDAPGAVVSVDNVYCGATPQHSGDVLRIRVPEGVREINARVKIDGKKYTARQTAQVVQDKENLVKFNWSRESALVAGSPVTSPVHAVQSGLQSTLPPNGLEVPGKNF